MQDRSPFRVFKGNAFIISVFPVFIQAELHNDITKVSIPGDGDRFFNAEIRTRHERILVMKKDGIKTLTYSAILLALALVLPFLTGQIPQVGNALCPMHIPVLLCGYICGWPWGLAVGFIAPLLRFLMFGMPPIIPTGLPMAFELAAYGAAVGILFKSLPKTKANIYVSLIGAMIIGRVVWGIVRCVMAAAFGIEFSAAIFVTAAITSAIPGIIVQIVLIPIIIMALQRAGIVENR